jgi:hypothetical protein
MPNFLPNLDTPVVDLQTGLMTQVWYERLQKIAFGSYADGLLSPDPAAYVPVLSTVTALLPGNAVPTFTATLLQGNYATIGRLCVVNIVAVNVAGGVAGAGAQQLQVSLPIPARVGALTARPLIGSVMNNSEETTAFGLLVGSAPGAPVMNAPLYYQKILGSNVDQLPITCVNFNNASRALTWQFVYAI